MRSLFLFVSIGLFLLFSACTSPGDRLGNELAKLEEEVRSAATSGDASKWNALMEQRDELAAEFELKRGDMTERQIEACNVALGAISGYEMKHTLNGLGDGFKDAMQQAEGMMKALKEEVEELATDTGTAEL